MSLGLGPESAKNEPSLVGRLIRLVLLLAVFVGIPLLATSTAPISIVTLDRQGGQVSADATSLLLFAIPVDRQHVTSVTGVATRALSSRAAPENPFRRWSAEQVNRTDLLDLGYLSLQGSGAAAEVPVEAAQISNVSSRIQQYLDQPGAPSQRFILHGGWVPSVIVPGVLLPIGLFTVFGMVMAPFRWLSSRKQS